MSLLDLASTRARRDAPLNYGHLEATVLDPPLNDDGWLRVEVDSQPGRSRECPFTPRADVDPAAGDAALVVESDQGNLWVVTWWPQQ